MRFNTQFTERFKLPIPMMNAPLPFGVTTPKMVARLAKTGLLGVIDGSDLSPRGLKRAIRKVKWRASRKPFAVHLTIPEFPNVSADRMSHTYELLKPFCEKLGINESALPDQLTPLFEEQMLVVLKERIPFFIFSNGSLHPEWVKLLRGSGTVIIGTATTVEEAQYLEDIGLHMIRMQGVEASGVHSNFLPSATHLDTETLMQETLAQVRLPLIAEGGIMTGKEILKFLNLGAAGISIGTAFLTAEESGASLAHKEALLSQSVEDRTVISHVFTGRKGRVLTNKLTDWGEHHPFEMLEYPVQKCLMRPIIECAQKKDLIEYLPLWSNGKSHLCKRDKIANIVKSMLVEIYNLIKN